MRAGVLISAISHVVLVLLALLGTPKLIDGTVPPVMVELVPPDEVPDPLKPEKEKEKSPAWDLPGAQSVPTPSPAPPAPAPSTPDNSRQALLKAPDPAQGPSVVPSAPETKPSVFDPAAIPLLLNLPNMQGGDFDAESTTIAKLS